MYDGVANKYIWTYEKMPADVFELIKCIDERFSDVGIQVCTYDRTFFAKENDVMQNFRKITKLPNYICDYRNVKDPIAKIIFGTDKEKRMQEIEQTLKAHPLSKSFDFVRSDRVLFEILPKGVNKGLALKKMTEYLNVDISRAIAIGDYNNDIGMFNAAGIGVAVSNACKAALDAADYVTVSNEEHAIARVIYDLESGRLKAKS